MQNCPKCGEPLSGTGTRHSTGARGPNEPVPTGIVVKRCANGHDWREDDAGELVFVP
jgi:hypothetical protein